MKKKALLLMLFFMFISTNAVSQVSCGKKAAEFDQECYEDELRRCEDEYNFYLGSCLPTADRCYSFCYIDSGTCNDRCEDVSDLCWVATEDWMTCSYEFFMCKDDCDNTNTRCREECANLEGNCRYVAGEKRFACQRNARTVCTSEEEE
jgi:hypothetical protein